MSSQLSPLVTVATLNATLAMKAANGNVQVLDVSWHLPTVRRDAPKEFAEKHIPTAQFFQLHPDNAKLLTPEKFGEDVGILGVGNDTHVVVYDNNPTYGMYSAPRAWWLFRYFGHEHVSILDGGLPKWEEAGYETTADVDKVKSKTFKATPNVALLTTIEDIEANIDRKQFTLVDGRPATSFLGTTPYPWPDIKPGRIKGSVNIPIYLLIDPNTKQMKCVDAIREVFKDASIDLDNTHVVATCGCGVTACFPILGAYICGTQTVPLYDGSWSEFFVKGKPENKIIPGDN